MNIKSIIPTEPKQKQNFFMLCGIAILQVLLVILWFSKIFVVKIEYIASMAISISGQSAFLDVMTVILGGVSVCSVFMYIIKTDYKKKYHIAVHIISAAWSLFWIFIALIGEDDRGPAKCSLNFLGVLFILFAIAVILLSIMVSLNVKKFMLLEYSKDIVGTYYGTGGKDDHHIYIYRDGMCEYYDARSRKVSRGTWEVKDNKITFYNAYKFDENKNVNLYAYVGNFSGSFVLEAGSGMWEGKTFNKSMEGMR